MGMPAGIGMGIAIPAMFIPPPPGAGLDALSGPIPGIPDMPDIPDMPEGGAGFGGGCWPRAAPGMKISTANAPALAVARTCRARINR
jgi:hypothetical protein